MSWFLRNVVVVLALAIGAFVLSLLLVKLLWVWTIPDLFPRAVEEGFIARNISTLRVPRQTPHRRRRHGPGSQRDSL